MDDFEKNLFQRIIFLGLNAQTPGGRLAYLKNSENWIIHSIHSNRFIHPNG